VASGWRGCCTTRRRIEAVASTGKSVQVNVDEAIVSQLREQSNDPARGDDALVAEALGAHLFNRTLRRIPRRSGLGEDEASRLAVEELHAMRRERDSAA
jgi:hypothetical protein